MDRDDFTFHEKIALLDSLNFQDWDNEEDDDISNDYDPNNRIYGIKFYHSNLKPNSNTENKNIINNCYIIIVTKNKIIQLSGPFENNSFKSLFEKYKNNHSLYNDSCKYFPKGDNCFGKMKDNNNFIDYDIDILINHLRFEKFGWKTLTGYCFGDYDYGEDYIPENIKMLIYSIYKNKSKWEERKR